VTDEERAAVRTAFRPFMDALAGRSGSVSPEEWATAVDRIFPATAPAESGLAEFLNRARSLHNIDHVWLPELNGDKWIAFRDDPVVGEYSISRRSLAAAIWREVERRQRRTA